MTKMFQDNDWQTSGPGISRAILCRIVSRWCTRGGRWGDRGS